jgi:DNA-binding NarL/FixJ family response regulator
LDGKKCLHELLRFNPEARIIIASGYVSQELGTEMLELGAKGLVGKPYDLERMLKVVRTTLDEGKYGLVG